MNEIEIRKSVVISIQGALLGMIYPSIRIIEVGFEGLQKLKVIYYLDREPNEDDYENIAEVTTEICADIDFKGVEEHCIYGIGKISKMSNSNI